MAAFWANNVPRDSSGPWKLEAFVIACSAGFCGVDTERFNSAGGSESGSSDAAKHEENAISQKKKQKHGTV